MYTYSAVLGSQSVSVVFLISIIDFYLSMYVTTYSYRSGNGLNIGLLQQQVTHVVT